MPSAPTARGGQRQRLDEVPATRGVARVDDDRQVAEGLQHRHGGEVEREAVRRLERADPALAQHDVGVAALEHVLRRHQQLLDRARQAALEQHRDPRATDLGQQRVVLHVARADLDHVGDVGHRLDVADVHDLGDDRQPGLRARVGEDLEAGLAEPLEGVRARARLVRAAAQHRGTRVADDARDRERLLACLDRARPGDQGERAAADAAAGAELDDARGAVDRSSGSEPVGVGSRDLVVGVRRGHAGHRVNPFECEAPGDGGDLRGARRERQNRQGRRAERLGKSPGEIATSERKGATDAVARTAHSATELRARRPARRGIGRSERVCHTSHAARPRARAPRRPAR